MEIHTEQNHSWFGRRGATSQRWEYDVICKAWRALAKKFPKLNASRRSRKLEALAADDTELSRACFEYIAKNFEGGLNRFNGTEDERPAPRPQPVKTPQQRTAEKAEHETRISEAVESIKQQINLLNLEMPNGKRWRYCTREEMVSFGKGYERIIKKMKPGQMVGQRFNAEELRREMQ